jgi:hypothetical protein
VTVCFAFFFVLATLRTARINCFWDGAGETFNGRRGQAWAAFMCMLSQEKMRMRENETGLHDQVIPSRTQDYRGVV